MNKLFVRFFLAELGKAGFGEAAYDNGQERLIISPKYSRLYVAYEGGEYLIGHDEESRSLLPKIRAIIDNAKMITSAWEHSLPMRAENLTRFRKLLEWNGVVLAVRDDGKRGLYYVTWRRSVGTKGVENGYYTDNIAKAMQNFVGRSGLYPRERLFDDAQVDLLRRTLEYRLEHDVGLYSDTRQEMKSILTNLEG